MKQKMILTDFGLPRWKDVDMNSIVGIIEKFNKNGGLFGEFGHPLDPRDDDFINKDNVVIQISNIVIEGRCCYGDVELVDGAKDSHGDLLTIDPGDRLSIRGDVVRKGGNVHFSKIVAWDFIKNKNL